MRGSVFIEMTFATMVANFGTGVTFAVLPSFADIRGGPALFGGMLGALGVGRALGAAIASGVETVKYGHIKIIGSAGSCFLWLWAVYVPWPPSPPVCSLLLGGVVGSTIRTLNTMAVAGLIHGFVGLFYAVRPCLRRLPAMNDIDPAEFDIRLDSLPESERSGESRGHAANRQWSTGRSSCGDVRSSCNRQWLCVVSGTPAASGERASTVA